MQRNRRIGYLPRKRVGSRSFHFVPSLTLSGNWLEELGFTTGATVVVQVEPGKITITV